MHKTWCRFESGGKIFHGRIDGDDVIALDGAPWHGGAETSVRHALSAVKLLVPVVPPTFYCVGQNYRAQAIAAAKRKGVEPKFREKPEVGYRSVGALCASGDPIIKPRDAGEMLEPEGELVVVIGTRGRHIARDQALAHVFGFTIGNDVSERDWQKSDRTNWRSKNADSFKPMGPWIVSGLDYRQMTTILRLNGQEIDRFATGAMIHDVESTIAELSKYCTLQPGDVLMMGNDGVSCNMTPGDVCEIEITGIGTLTNPVVAE